MSQPLVERLDWPIAAFVWPVRARYLFEVQPDIKTLGDLIAFPDAQILRIANLGSTTLRVIREAQYLALYGLDGWENDLLVFLRSKQNRTNNNGMVELHPRHIELLIEALSKKETAE